MKKLTLLLTAFLVCYLANSQQVTTDTSYYYNANGDSVRHLEMRTPAVFTYFITTTRDEIIPKQGTPPPNTPPEITAIPAITITSPATSVSISVTATDPGGSIADYKWVQTAGPTVATLTASDSKTVAISNLTTGSYMFKVTVTDNLGATSVATANVTVNAAMGGGTGGYTVLLYSNNFDNASSLSTNQLGVNSTPANSISTTIFKSGTGSFRSIVYPGKLQVSGGYRSEQQYPGNYSPDGQETAFEYDELFESYPDVAGLTTQWHGNAAGTSGQMSMWTQSHQFMVQRNIIGTAGSSNIYQSGTLMPILLNHWYHFRWEIKFSTGSDGYARCYIDGTSYFSVTGKTSDGTGQYLKVGQNLFASPSNNSILYIDNLNIWKKP